MGEPVVTVIIPVYNTAAFLPQCLDSVLAQTLREIEVICIDDGSTDASLEVLRGYEKKDARLTVLTEQNGGGGAARNRGLAQARGRYLSFLDSDDFFAPEMLEKAVQAAEKHRADVVVFGITRYDNATGRYLPTPEGLRREYLPAAEPFSRADMPDTLFNAFQNWAENKLFRRAFITEKGIRFQELRRTNDLLFTCSALVLAERIATVRQGLAFYRVGTPFTCQATNDVAPLDFLHAFAALRDTLCANGLYGPLSRSYLNALADGIWYNLRSVRTLAAFEAVYDQVRGQVLPQIGFETLAPDTFRDAAAYRFLRAAQGQTAGEYLFAAYRDAQGLAGAGQSPELQAVYSSVSYRLGRALTALPRKVRQLLRKK